MFILSRGTNDTKCPARNGPQHNTCVSVPRYQRTTCTLFSHYIYVSAATSTCCRRFKRGLCTFIPPASIRKCEYAAYERTVLEWNDIHRRRRDGAWQENRCIGLPSTAGKIIDFRLPTELVVSRASMANATPSLGTTRAPCIRKTMALGQWAWCHRDTVNVEWIAQRDRSLSLIWTVILFLFTLIHVSQVRANEVGEDISSDPIGSIIGSVTWTDMHI